MSIPLQVTLEHILSSKSMPNPLPSEYYAKILAIIERDPKAGHRVGIVINIVIEFTSARTDKVVF